MEYDPNDSSGTDDDLPPANQNRGARLGPATGNERSVGPKPYPRARNTTDMEAAIHRLEREAYNAVLRAFKAQADAISWEKENLISDLRRELRLSDEEHREILSKVNADDLTRRIREWRQTGVVPPSAIHEADQSGPTISTSHKRHISPPFHGQPVSSSGGSKWGPPPSGSKGKKPKLATPSNTRSQVIAVSNNNNNNNNNNNDNNNNNSINNRSGGPLADTENGVVGWTILMRWPDDNTFYRAVIKEYDPIKGLHALVYDIGTNNETWEWLNLKEIAPEDIRWDGKDPGISNNTNNNGVYARRVRGSGPGGLGLGFSKNPNPPKNDYNNVPPSQNGNGASKKSFDSCLQLPNTESVIKEVERVLSNPSDTYEIEKAKKLLKEHEQSLLDAIARLAEVSDRESDEGNYC